jgi:hypothetical protein
MMERQNHSIIPTNPEDQHRFSPRAKSCARLYTRADYHRAAKKAFDGRWRANRHERRTLDRVMRCQWRRSSYRILRRHEVRYRRHHLRRLERRDQLRALTPYDCGAAGRFAVPCPIVFRESRYSWTAANPASSAVGPYQLLDMHGRPWPIRSRADRLEHHRIAARLWDGGAGASHWALTCC